MEEHRVVRSEVHGDNTCSQTTFTVHLLNKTTTIDIMHQSESLVDLVGLQVWQGSLMMADFLINLREVLEGRCILELGSGTGFLAALLCHPDLAFDIKRIWATDFAPVVAGTRDESILRLCELNARRMDPNGLICQVRELNLCHSIDSIDFQGSTRYQWKSEDVELWKTCDLILASDVVYDDGLTVGLIERIFELLNSSQSDRVLYISLEKRLVFMKESLQVEAPAYDFFWETFHFLNESISQSTGTKIEATSIDIDSIPQFMDYERSSMLELWRFRKINY